MPIMAGYFRGWKGSSSRHPTNQRLDRRSIIRPRKRSAIWKKVFFLGIILGFFVFIFFGVLFAYYSFNLPDPNKLAARIVPESTKIFDKNGELLYEIHGEAKRTLIPLSEVPDFAKQAAIAIEDKNFYKHGGISFTGIFRAVVVNVLSGSKRQGGSTITQQFVRTAVLTREKAFTRKFKEIVLSLQLERKYSKDEILQLYLNEIPYGSNAYGIQAASQTFFGKDAKNLTLTESAYLAAMPKAPTYYSPYGPRRDELDARAKIVLQVMYEQGYITEAQRNSAQSEKVRFSAVKSGITAPHFVLYIQDLLAQKFGEISLQEGGFRVVTALDMKLQQIAEEAVARQVPLNEKNYNAGNAALVALDPRSGQILAMVGSRDYFDEKHDGAVNVALRARQPGSSFKPYVYAAAFKAGMNPATVLLDVQTNFGNFGGRDYIPQNYNGQNYGPVSIRKALQGSLNIPAVKTVLLTGIENSISLAEKMGISTLKDRSRYGPSIVLGGGEVKLLEHVSAFGVFAAGGLKHDPVPILKIEDSKGRVLEEYRESRGKEVLDPQVAYQVNHVLSDNPARSYIFGSANRLNLPGRPVAAKTGTTESYRDAWTVGYTPQIAVGVWVGNSNNSAMKVGADGSVVAGPIWNEFMRRSLENQPVEAFQRPEGIVELAVDPVSGKLPTQHTPTTVTEVFASFNSPSEVDDVHVPITVGGDTRIYTILRSEKPNDPEWENPVRAWADAHGFSYPPSSGSAGSRDKNPEKVQVRISAPNKITSLPWKAAAEIISAEEIGEVVFLLDGRVLSRGSSGPFEYSGSAARVDGPHSFTVQVTTKNGSIASQSANIEFALGQKLLFLDPQDNQVIKLPVNLVVETDSSPALGDIRFFFRGAAGIETQISGKITKQQLNAKVQHFTLNWTAVDSPRPGSYAIYAKAGTGISNEAVIKIQ